MNYFSSVPVAPDKASIVTVNSSYAVIHLDSWHHGGCPITKYKIRYRLLTSDGPSDWMEIYHSNYNDKQIEIRDLYSGTRYQLQITAYNDVGFTGKKNIQFVKVLIILCLNCRS